MSGDSEAASNYFLQLEQEALKTLGPDHSTTLAVRRHQAMWLEQSGDTIGAATKYRAIFQDQIRVISERQRGTGTNGDRSVSS